MIERFCGRTFFASSGAHGFGTYTYCTRKPYSTVMARSPKVPNDNCLAVDYSYNDPVSIPFSRCRDDDNDRHSVDRMDHSTIPVRRLQHPVISTSIVVDESSGLLTTKTVELTSTGGNIETLTWRTQKSAVTLRHRDNTMPRMITQHERDSSAIHG